MGTGMGLETVRASGMPGDSPRVEFAASQPLDSPPGPLPGPRPLHCIRGRPIDDRAMALNLRTLSSRRSNLARAQPAIAGSTERVLRRTVFAFFVASATAASPGQKAPDLRPVDGLYSSPSLADPYHFALRDALLGEHSYRKCQMVVLPSFRAEWVVYIVQDDAQRGGRLFYKTMHTALWGDMMRQIEQDAPNPGSYSLGPEAQSAALTKVEKKVDVYAVDLDAPTIGTLERAWSDMLARTRYPTQLELGIDGTSYIAANWSQGDGPRSGEVWSPEEGTPTHDLVAIAERLRDLATASQDTQPRLKADAAAMAVALHARVKALK
jgi:hypothetical protein